MRIGFMGRSRLLLDVLQTVSRDKRHSIAFVWTSKAEEYYDCSEQQFEDLADSAGCPFYFSPHIGDVEPLIDFNSLDVVLSVNFVNIIPASFLNRVRMGVLNAHAGDLPRYKGNACPNWAILNNEEKVVLTVHEMRPELDAGPIYFQTSLGIGEDTYITDIYAWLERSTPECFLGALEKLQEGIAPTPQASTRSLRTFPRKPEDARINWSDGVETIYRLIRASSRPFGGARCFINHDVSQEVNIFRAEPCSVEYDFYAVDGQLIEKHDDCFVVASGNKPLRVTDFDVNGMSQEESLSIVTSSMRNRLT